MRFTLTAYSSEVTPFAPRRPELRGVGEGEYTLYEARLVDREAKEG